MAREDGCACRYTERRNYPPYAIGTRFGFWGIARLDRVAFGVCLWSKLSVNWAPGGRLPPGSLSQRYERQNTDKHNKINARLNRARLAALLFRPPMTGHDDWAWIHGDRSQTAGKARSSLVVYFATEGARDRVVRNSLTINSLWYHAKL